MKIAFLLPDFPRRSETFILTQLEGLLDRGHDVVVYAARPPADALNHAAEERYGSLRRDQPRPGHAILPRLLNGIALAARHVWRHPRLIARALNPARFGMHALSFAALHAAVPWRDRPVFDVVHCHFGTVGVFGAILQELGVLRGPLVVTFYGHDVTRYPRAHGTDVYRRLFARAELVLALDPVMRDRLEALGASPAQLDVHPLGVDCTRFAPPASHPAHPPLRLLSVGRCVEKKGFADGLRAIAILRARGHHIVYRIVGDGPLEPALRDLARELELGDTVEFLGSVSHADISALMVSSHALVAPSVRAADGDEEGTPTVIIEAMASGLPVVATRHAGVPFLVEDGVTGWLVDEHDPEALADQICLLVDPDLAARMGTAARTAALQRFETRELTARLEARYATLAENSSAGRGGSRS